MEIIKVQNVTKLFKQSVKGTISFFPSSKISDKTFKAVDDVSFSIEEGEFIGFIGPNGAGKSTTLKMLSGILAPTHGTIKILGFNPVERHYEFLSSISMVMGNKFQINTELPPIDTFDLHRVIYKLDKILCQARIDELASILGIEEKLNTQFKRLSLGEKMKCEVILSLLHNPKILFLDEPTIGLDIVSQKNLRDFLKKLNKDQGTTILLTSHYMEDVKELCPRIILINKGKKLFDDSIDKMIKEYSDSKTTKFIINEPGILLKLKTYVDLNYRFEIINLEDTEIKILVPNDMLSTFLSDVLGKFNINDLTITEKPLEEIVRELYR